MGAPLNVFGSQPAGAGGLTAFVDKGFDGDDFAIVEHIGKAAIFRVHGPEEVNTKYGLKTAIKADVVVLGGADGAKEYKGVLVFSMIVVDQLQALAGQTTVARISSKVTKTGNTAAKLEEAQPGDVEAATAYLSQADTPPF